MHRGRGVLKPELQVHPAHEVLRLGEDGPPLPVHQTPDVVGVAVGEEDVGDVLGKVAGKLQVGEEPPPTSRTPPRVHEEPGLPQVQEHRVEVVAGGLRVQEVLHERPAEGLLELRVRPPVGEEGAWRGLAVGEDHRLDPPYPEAVKAAPVHPLGRAPLGPAQGKASRRQKKPRTGEKTPAVHALTSFGEDARAEGPPRMCSPSRWVWSRLPWREVYVACAHFDGQASL